MDGISIGKPKEPSVWGMMVISALMGLVFSKSIDNWGTFIAILGVFTNIITFDSTMNSLRTRKYSSWILLVFLNSTPYIIGLIYWKSQIIIPYLVATTVLLFHVLLAQTLGWRNPITYIWGASIPVLPGILVPALSGGTLTWKAWISWILLSIYAMTTAAYVETRLAYRRMNPFIPLVVLAPSIASLLRAPCLAISLLEPFIKVLSNIKSRRLVAVAGEIKKMGWIELFRLYIFVVLIIIILKIIY